MDGGSRRAHEGASLRDYLNVVRRRRWIILQALIIVPVVAVAVSLRKPNLYESASQVLVSRQSVTTYLAGVPDVYGAQDEQRYAQTQAFLARDPRIAERVVADAKIPGLTAAGFLGGSSVSASSDTDLLTFKVTNAVPAQALHLANLYAKEFTLYRQRTDTAAIEQARAQVQARMRAVAKTGDTSSALYQSLDSRDQELQTVEALQRANAYVARYAGAALKVQPRPRRDGLLGLGLGLVLGVGLAFLREAFDMRIRSMQEIGDRLGIPLLGRIAEPPRRLRTGDQLVMLAEPRSVAAESFRILRTNLELANIERQARLIMVTSAVEEEGKTTTVSNLAVAVARAGRSGVLVDLDLRRPAVDRYFGIERTPGVTTVAVGDATLEDALVTIPINDLAGPGGPEADHGNTPAGRLEVLPSGPVPPDPGEWIGNHVLAGILLELRARFDLVLVDTPPLLHVGDAMALSTRMDAMIVVSKLTLARRGMLSEVKRLLETIPATKLGYVVTDADGQPDYDLGDYGLATYGYNQEQVLP